jgi:uncharacterized membrane protein YbhN (UPF0104 family)
MFKGFFFKIFLAIIILTFILVFNKNNILDINYQVNLSQNFFLFLFLKLLSLLLIALRWNCLCQTYRYYQSYLKCLNAVIFGHLLSYFTPGHIAQDVTKFYFLRKYNIIFKKDAFLVCFYDRIIGLISFIFLNLIIFLLWIFFFYNISFFVVIKFTLLLFLLIFFFFQIIIFLNKKFILYQICKLKRNLNTIFKLFILGILSHFINLMSFAIIAITLSEINFFTNLVLISLSLFGNLFPFTPSGLGVTELIFDQLYNFFNSNIGFELGVLIRYYSFIVVFLMTIILLILSLIMFFNEKNKN